MKKYICILVCLTVFWAAAGCGSSDYPSEAGGGRTAGADNASEQDPAENYAPEQGSAGADGADEIDVDLTVLSATMVYSEVYNMMSDPEKYVGKTVKMNGLFASYHDEAADKYYFACVIQDAMACCAQGIEFVLTDDYAYPDDYPEVNAQICVVGVFDTYEENGATYCTLRQANLL